MLHEEASVKTPIAWGSETFQLGKHIHTEKSDTAQLHGDRTPVPRSLPDLTQCVSYLPVHLYPLPYPNALVNASKCSQSAVSRSSQLTNPEKGLGEPPVCSHARQSVDYLGTHSLRLARAMGWEQPHRTSGI